MQGILRIITAQVETKKQRKIMNKSGIITTHGLTLNLLTSFFYDIDLCQQKRLEKEKEKRTFLYLSKIQNSFFYNKVIASSTCKVFMSVKIIL